MKMNSSSLLIDTVSVLTEPEYTCEKEEYDQDTLIALNFWLCGVTSLGKPLKS